MGDYDAINDEIKNFLSLVEKKPEEDAVPKEPASRDDLARLIELLTSLQGVYNEINTNLGAGDADGLKSVVLNSDVKMSLVCESLMRVLKDVSQEKSELAREADEHKARIRRLGEEKEALEIRMNKMESDLEFVNRGNQELSRMIRDQKNKMQGFKEKADLEKRNGDSLRSINEELEVLRRKALEKCEVYEKEIGVLREHVRERAEEIVRLRGECKKDEALREEAGKRVVAAEKANEMLRKKLEMKEHALGMCNSELSRLISKEKRAESELERMRERASYYERLYKATNSQNEYLNGQLSRMIKSGERVAVPEYDPDAQQEETAMCGEKSSRETERSFRKRLRRYKRKSREQKEATERQREEMEGVVHEVERLRGEVARLQEERERTIAANARMSNELMSKVERLLEKNREYQGMIYELRGKEPRESRVHVDGNESFKTVNDGENEVGVGDSPMVPRILGRERAWEGWPEARSFGMSGRYERGTKDDGGEVGAFDEIHEKAIWNIDSRLNAQRRHERKAEERSGDVPVRMNLPDSFYTSLAKPNEEGLGVEGKGTDGAAGEPGGWMRSKVGCEDKDSVLSDPFDSLRNKNGVGAKGDDRVSDGSTESPRTVRTSSTLHDMLRRTDVLQQKFDKLESQLNAIKSSDKVDAEKMQEQIKAYKNYYYSDYLDMSNGSDVI